MISIKSDRISVDIMPVWQYFRSLPNIRFLTRNRLGGGVFRPPPPSFFQNNSWTLADIDMKLGMTLRTSILRRLVKEKSDSGKKIWDIADFVTSPPAILVRKI